MSGRAQPPELRALSVALLACAVAACNAWRLFALPYAWGEPASDRWVRVHHPELPISFEIPDNTRGPLANLPWLLGGPDRTSDAPADPLRWGIRAVWHEDRTSYALEFAFLWLRAGVGAGRLARLSSNLDDGRAVIQFYREVFDPKFERLTFFDGQADLIDGLPGRMIGADHILGPGEQSRYQVFVIPVRANGVLVIAARFWSPDLPEERDEIFPRIARSVRFDPGVLED